MDYTVLRHARVEQANDENLAYLAIAQNTDGDGRTNWTLEFWEDHGEGNSDLVFTSEAEAEAYAEAEFGIPPDDWNPGPQPLGPNP